MNRRNMVWSANENARLHWLPLVKRLHLFAWGTLCFIPNVYYAGVLFYLDVYLFVALRVIRAPHTHTIHPRVFTTCHPFRHYWLSSMMLVSFGWWALYGHYSILVHRVDGEFNTSFKPKAHPDVLRLRICRKEFRCDGGVLVLVNR